MQFVETRPWFVNAISNPGTGTAHVELDEDQNDAGRSIILDFQDGLMESWQTFLGNIDGFNDRAHSISKTTNSQQNTSMNTRANLSLIVASASIGLTATTTFAKHTIPCSTASPRAAPNGTTVTGGFWLATPPACVGDLNIDGVVNVSDLTIFLGRFGQSCEWVGNLLTRPQTADSLPA